jgi:hypothetical protein
MRPPDRSFRLVALAAPSPHPVLLPMQRCSPPGPRSLRFRPFALVTVVSAETPPFRGLLNSAACLPGGCQPVIGAHVQGLRREPLVNELAARQVEFTGQPRHAPAGPASFPPVPAARLPAPASPPPAWSWHPPVRRASRSGSGGLVVIACRLRVRCEEACLVG